MKYFGNFAQHGRAQVAAEFEEFLWAKPRAYDDTAPLGEPNETFPTEDEILFASYETPGYEGEALVLFERDGRIYEVNASHCSCMGLEGQWKPEETLWPALRMRLQKSGEFYGVAGEALVALTLLITSRTGESQ